MKKTLIALALLATASTSTMVQAASDDAHWIFRAGVAHVSPNDSSGAVLGNDGVAVDSGTALGLNVTYMYNKNWGVELLAASPFSHDITGTGALSGLKIGETDQLPPTVSLIYQWGDEIKYHVGAGINHTIFFDSKTSSELTAALGADSTDVDLDSSTGLAFKFGVDIPLTKDWSFSAGVYYIDIDTSADVIVNGAVATTVDVEIDPVVYLVGFSMRY